MAFEEKIENLYLKVWKAVILCVATAALIAAVAASAAAINGLFVEAPHPPVELKPEERGEALLQELTIENFKEADVQGATAVNPRPSEPGPAPAFVFGESVRRITTNLDNYVKTAFPRSAPIQEATEWNVKHVMKGLELKDDERLKLYLSTLESLSTDLAKAGGAQAMLPEEKRINPHRMLRWHAEAMQRAFQSLDQENAKLQKSYQQKLVDYANRHTRIMSYIGVAAGAVAIFVFTIFLFVIIRIERDLRAMAVASMATTKQLES